MHKYVPYEYLTYEVEMINVYTNKHWKFIGITQHNLCSWIKFFEINWKVYL